MGFWTFSLTVELIIVPATVLISALYAIASMDKKHLSAKRFFEVLFAVWGVVIFINAISCLFISPGEFFSLDTLKSLLLPLVLLVFNLPVIYGLALYNMYEQVFIRVKGIRQEQRKMKWQVIRFAGLSLSRVAAIRKNLPTTIVFCKTSQQLKINLINLSKRLDLQIGDNPLGTNHIQSGKKHLTTEEVRCSECDSSRLYQSAVNRGGNRRAGCQGSRD